MKISLRQYRDLLLRYLRPQRLWVLALSALLFGDIGLQLVNPQVMRRFIDSAQAGGAPTTLFRTALLADSCKKRVISFC